MSHGGPTAMAKSQLTLETQFWTTRGFAVVDVNYGGSAGGYTTLCALVFHDEFKSGASYYGVADVRPWTETPTSSSRGTSTVSSGRTRRRPNSTGPEQTGCPVRSSCSRVYRIA